MKKFYAFAAAAAMAITMSAQAPLYITGEGDAINNWSPDAPAEMTFADGKYTFTAELNSFQISTAKGTWDEFNDATPSKQSPKNPEHITSLQATQTSTLPGKASTQSL